MNTRGTIVRAGATWPPIRPASGIESAGTFDLLDAAGIVQRTEVAGVFAWMPNGVSFRNQIRDIALEELGTISYAQVEFPTLQKSAPWHTTGRWTRYMSDGTMFPVEGGQLGELCIGPTTEEMVALGIAQKLKSYKDLPARISSSTVKYRNEKVARDGLMRAREFEMVDAYSFAEDATAIGIEFDQLNAACRRVLRRLGLTGVTQVDASVGDIGGSRSTEHLLLHPSGESPTFACAYCGHTTTDADASDKSLCAACGQQPLSRLRAVELAHVFDLGTAYSEPMGAYFTDSSGDRHAVHMATAGIGVGRVMQALAESGRDSFGLRWPLGVGPFDVHVVVIRPGSGDVDMATRWLSGCLETSGIRVFVDDRDVSTGTKFRYARLAGICLQVVVSSGADTPKFELRDRMTGRRWGPGRDDIIAEIVDRMNHARNSRKGINGDQSH